jgi:DNA-binding IclR family transcriptional regulator
VEALNLPKPTAYRLVDWFVEMGFLAREPSRRKITVGPRLRNLAIESLRTTWRQAPRQAILESLVAEIGETCNVGVLDRGSVVYLDRVEVNWPLRLQFGTGSRVPLHCTAIGKLFLAFMPGRQRRQLLNTLDLAPFTPHTITDPALLEAELTKIRSEGVSLDREEFLAGVVCMAVPIFDANSNIEAAIAIQAPTARLRLQDATSHLPALRRAAERLSASFSIAD